MAGCTVPVKVGRREVVTEAVTLAALMPEVSCVWKWIGRPVSSRSVVTSLRIAAGRATPAMSLTARMCAPAFSSSFAIVT